MNEPSREDLKKSQKLAQKVKSEDDFTLEDLFLAEEYEESEDADDIRQEGEQVSG